MPDKALPTLLDELSKMALRVFLNQLNVRANNLLANVELPPDDLSAPSDLEDVRRHSCIMQYMPYNRFCLNVFFFLK